MSKFYFRELFITLIFSHHKLHSEIHCKVIYYIIINQQSQ